MSLTKAIEHGKELRYADAFDFAPNQFREIPVVAGRHMQQTPDAPEVEADMEEAGATGDEGG